MTGSLPREAITFGVDDLFYAPLRVVRAAELDSSGRSIGSSPSPHFQLPGAMWGPHVPWDSPKLSFLLRGKKRHDEESWQGT